MTAVLLVLATVRVSSDDAASRRLPSVDADDWGQDLTIYLRHFVVHAKKVSALGRISTKFRW
jgi:hypothetical protein